MPTYEYECDACGHRFDEFQSITANPLRKCPECGRLKLRRLIGTGGAVIFKGGGFYETDYRSEGYRKAEEADRKSTDSKPAAETTSVGSAGGSSGDAGAPGKTETSKAASGDASGKGDGSKAGSSASSSSDGTGDAAGASKPAAPTSRRAPAAGTSASKSTTSGKRHAREGRGVGNLKPAARSGSTKKSGRRGRA